VPVEVEMAEDMNIGPTTQQFPLKKKPPLFVEHVHILKFELLIMVKFKARGYLIINEGLHQNIVIHIFISYVVSWSTTT
jgi:hypothetical protein